MKIAALAAAVTMALAPAMAGAQQACPPNATPGEGGLCVCVSGTTLQNGQCVEAEAVTVVTGGTADVPVMSEIPTGAIVVGGLVLLGGVIIGILAATDDDETTTTTTTSTTGTN